MKYRVKKRWPLLGVALTALAGFAVIAVCFREVDHLGYQELQRRANPSLPLESEEPYRASQERQGVRKEFWQAKAGKRLRTVMTCSSAELAFEKEGDGQAIVEHMNDVSCTLSADTSTKMRVLEASHAKIHYSTQHLVADNVTVKLLQSSSDSMAPQAILSGKADHVEHVMDRKGKAPLVATGNVEISLGSTVEAHCHQACFEGEDSLTLQEGVVVLFHDHGTLTTTEEVKLYFGDTGIRTITCTGRSEYRCDNDEKGLDLVLVTDGDILVDNEKQEVTFHKGSEQIFFRDNQRKVYADQAKLSYAQGVEGFQFKDLDLQGEVKLYHRSGALLQYVLADRVLYDHETRGMRFLGSKRRRALFFDKINDLKVSAPEIKMWHDGKSQSDRFKGVGDVRFHFAEGEFERLRKHFLSEKGKL